MQHPLPIGILGATGMVGQRMVQLLAGHPWFQTAVLAASQRSIDRPYANAAPWRLEGEVPAEVAGRTVVECDPARFPAGVRVVLSALDGKVAGPIEAAFRDAGFAVITNASAWRAHPTVPLVIPEVNPHHLALLDPPFRQEPGFIVANPNCCAVPLAMVLAPLHTRWGVQSVTVATYQAVSGAGYPGESAWDVVGSVHPHAGDEEDKLQTEPVKILGTATAPARFPVSARCVRVPAADGHMLAVHARLAGDPTPEAVTEVLESWIGAAPELPSCPRPPLLVTRRRDRPNTRLDVGAGAGMRLVVGRVERCPVMGIKLFVLAHNTIRGAAGAALANAELLLATGRLGGEGEAGQDGRGAALAAARPASPR